MGTLSIYCSGCKKIHVLEDTNNDYLFDFSTHKPTVVPAIRVYELNTLGEMDLVCHFSLIGGVMRFYPDSTHSLRGKDISLATFNYKE